MYDHEIDVLTSLQRFQSSSLRNGERLRNAMHAEIEMGGNPQGYRVDFLKAGVIRMFTLLEEISTDFNTEFAAKRDRFSDKDLGDLISSCWATLQDRDE